MRGRNDRRGGDGRAAGVDRASLASEKDPLGFSAAGSVSGGRVERPGVRIVVGALRAVPRRKVAYLGGE